MNEKRGRWPRWVFGVGEEPDYRFTFANERTFLAWLRTGLALLAAGVAVDAFELDFPANVQQILAILLVLLAVAAAVTAWWRWATAERAMRLHSPLPSSPFGAVLALGVVAIACIVLVVELVT